MALIPHFQALDGPLKDQLFDIELDPDGPLRVRLFARDDSGLGRWAWYTARTWECDTSADSPRFSFGRRYFLGPSGNPNAVPRYVPQDGLRGSVYGLWFIYYGDGAGRPIVWERDDVQIDQSFASEPSGECAHCSRPAEFYKAGLDLCHRCVEA